MNKLYTINTSEYQDAQKSFFNHNIVGTLYISTEEGENDD